MPATVDMYEDIDSLNLNWKNDVFIGELPKELQVDKEKTLILISESQNEPTDYGNDSFSAIHQEVEVEVFYSVDFDEDIDLVEINLMKELEKKGWRIATSKPHFSDPDTNQVIKVFYFGKKLQIKEKNYASN